MSRPHPPRSAGVERTIPIALRLRGPGDRPLLDLPYGGALPEVAPGWRADLRSDAGLDIRFDPAAVDPLASRAFGVLYGHLRAEQVVLAVSARTNLTLAGSTIRVIGDGPLATALTTLLRRVGAAVVRSTDDPLERLAATLDGVRVDSVAAAAADASAHAALLTGVGHDDLSVTEVAGLVADASPRPTDATAWPASRPHVHTTPKGWIVDLPSPLPTDDAPPSHAQRRILDALLAALIVDGGPDDDRGVFAAAVTP